MKKHISGFFKVRIISFIVINSRLLFVGVFLVASSCNAKKTSSDNSDITAINVNDVALDLISLFHDKKIEESSKKGAFMGIIAGLLYEQFNEIGYGFRIKECSEKWRFFEDGKYRILVGSVYKSEKESSIFVWLWEDSGQKQKVIYMSLGNEVIVGKEYPKGIIPYKK